MSPIFDAIRQRATSSNLTGDSPPPLTATSSDAESNHPTSHRNGAVELNDVTVAFEQPTSPDQSVVLSDLSIHVEQGEFLVIVGKSGCGKTTVLNLLVGFISPNRGTVSVMGASPKVARRHVGYMFANDALLPWRSALGSVELGLELKGVPKRERRRISQERLASLGLGDKGHLYPSQLSRGMRQRVALARTWTLDPDLLLMDEPFGALDAQTRTAVQREFLDMWSERRQTVVFVTHDLTEAIIMADRILVMGNGGRIHDEVHVPIPRPRDPVEILDRSDYRHLYRRLNDAISAVHAS